MVITCYISTLIKGTKGKTGQILNEMILGVNRRTVSRPEGSRRKVSVDWRRCGKEQGKV